MPIPQFLLDRIRSSAMSGPQVAAAFAKLAQIADQTDGGGCAINIKYVRDNDTLLPGDLIPTITLSLAHRKDAVSLGDPPPVAEAACEVFPEDGQ